MSTSEMSEKDAKHFIAKAEFPDGGFSKDVMLASAPKSVRLSLIRESQSDEARTSAAIEIQRCFRGHHTRCKILGHVEPKVSETAVYSGSKHLVDRLPDVRTPTPDARGSSTRVNGHKEDLGNETLESLYEEYIRRLRLAGVEDIPNFEQFCQDQNLITTAREEREKGVSSKGAGQLVRTPSGIRVGKPPRGTPYSNEEAASMIQRAWRRHIDIQVYRYYRDLINFKQRGDPSLMLRCINPNEAKFLDSAAGVHVKFRLAGDKFPPNIYYKIFTHRNIVDMCANSPKDYTKAGTKRKMGRDVHNKGNRGPFIDVKEGWYERYENNGWRLVSDRLLTHILSDPVTWETSQKKVQFHHNKLQRKQDVERQRKQKKIQWMQKMYKEGMMKAKVEDPETVQLIEGAAAGMVATIDVEGPEAVQEWEVDELLEWTTSLNYDDYLDGWKEIATSSKSEKNAEDRLYQGRLYTASSTESYYIFPNEGQEDGRAHVYSGAYDDPFMLTISASPSRNQDAATRPSHNTPVSSVSGGHV